MPLLLTVGCAAYKLPVTDTVQTDTGNSSVESVLVLAEGRTEYELTSFKMSLRDSGIAVLQSPTDNTLGKTPSAKLRDGRDGRCFSEPLLTVMTLGVIPSYGCAVPGFVFELSGGPLREPVELDTRIEVRLVWGWAALFLLPSKDWVGERGLQSYNSDRLSEAITSAIDAVNPDSPAGKAPD